MRAAAAAAGGVDWDLIFRLDLVYQHDCWRLCGDAHCCSFARHKARFRILGGQHAQELPLLPGEFEFLQRTGAVKQFHDFVHKRSQFVLDDRRAIPVESIVSSRAGCACDHDTRPTICRLYPLFPVHDLDGRLLGIEPAFGIYEELENLEQMPRACELGSLPFEQLAVFLELVGHLANSPLHLFCLHAYRLAKRHATATLRHHLTQQAGSAFGLFEWLLMKGRLFDQSRLRTELTALADAFAERYGDRFVLPEPVRA